VRSVRDLHDELSDRLAILCNLLDSQAGKSGIEENLRVVLRKLRMDLADLADLLNAQIPVDSKAPSRIFSIEIRSQISVVKANVPDLGETIDEGLSQLISEIVVELNFPQYFLNIENSSGVTIGELTRREREILKILPRGLTSKAMASELFLTEATIKSHISAIYRKFDVVNRTQAIAVALDNKLLAF
jgi:DNA-binding CsgD family transcriptional regulator|tara:strand:+ start:693 stop:1256 length:564 start_codon:yes stop_codon:yes gene_type:complete